MMTREAFDYGKPNVKYIIDNHGQGWLCDANISGSDLRDQGCVPADDWHYDRMFGG
jgi:hypothetical protein